MFRRSGTSKRDRAVVVSITDTHAGHSLGLLHPETVLIRAEPGEGELEEWTPPLTITQQRLWRLYEHALARIDAYADGDPVFVLFGGDATNGDVYPNGIIPGTTYGDQRVIAARNLEPLLQLPAFRAMRLVTGTYVHVHGSAEARIVKRLRVAVPGADVAICHHARLTIGGVVFDVAHHGPSAGSREWLHGNVARYHLRDRMYRDWRHGVEPARVYLRHHYHTAVREAIHDRWQGQPHTSELYVVPSMCGFTDHARKVTRSDPFLTNGLIMWEIVDGTLGEPVELTETLDLRTEEVLL